MRLLTILVCILLSGATSAWAQVTLDLHALQALPEHRETAAPSRSTLPSTEHASTSRQPGRTTVSIPSQPTAPPTTSAEGTTAQAQPPVATPSGPLSAPAPSSSPAAPATASSGQTSAGGQASVGGQASAGGQAMPAQPTTLPAAQPTMPQAPPQTAMITPIAPPPAPTTPAPPPPVSNKAATSAEPTEAGIRLIFAPGQSDLSPESVESLKKLAAGSPGSDTASFNVLAYAPGTADDPSTARRNSLSRAMAVRSALIADGVSSARIYVRALGSQYGNGPADRVDINVLGENAGTTSQATPSQPTPK